MILSTGWRRPIGYLRLQVIFHKRATNYRALLHKMTYKHKASCGSSPPCILIITVFCKESKHLDTYRVAKTHRIPYLYRSFFAKVTWIWWLFCGKLSATCGILRVFATLYHARCQHMTIAKYESNTHNAGLRWYWVFWSLWGGYD